MKTIYAIFFGGTFLLLLSSFYQDNRWIVPEKEAIKKNPIESNEKSLKLGKKLYGKMCWTCHGVEGKGDGPAATALTPKPADFRNESVQAQKDGALYWKLTTGKGSMTSYKNTLTDDQRWAIVNYLRTLKK